MLPNDRVQAIPADIGKLVRPIPIKDKVLEVDVGSILTIVFVDSILCLEFWNFLFLFWWIGFIRNTESIL